MNCTNGFCHSPRLDYSHKRLKRLSLESTVRKITIVIYGLTKEGATVRAYMILMQHFKHLPS